MEYADPQNVSNRFRIGVPVKGTRKLPNGMQCVTPLDETTAIEAGLLPIREVHPVLDENEVEDGMSVSVSSTRITHTYKKRTLTEEEISLREKNKMNVLDEIEDIKTRLLKLENQR